MMSLNVTHVVPYDMRSSIPVYILDKRSLFLPSYGCRLKRFFAPSLAQDEAERELNEDTAHQQNRVDEFCEHIVMKTRACKFQICSDK